MSEKCHEPTSLMRKLAIRFAAKADEAIHRCSLIGSPEQVRPCYGGRCYNWRNARRIAPRTSAETRLSAASVRLDRELPRWRASSASELIDCVKPQPSRCYGHGCIGGVLTNSRPLLLLVWMQCVCSWSHKRATGGKLGARLPPVPEVLS
jgi:hypothetical protein